MFCPTCGHENREASRFCNDCGAEMPTTKTPKIPPSPEMQAAQKKDRKAVASVVAGFLLIGLLFCIPAITDEYKRRSNQASSDVTVSNFVPPKIIPKDVEIKIVHQPVMVNASNFSWYEFTISPEMRNPKLIGGFEARGGRGNDIQVIVTDETGFINLQNNHQFRSFYSSNKITADTLELGLPAGKYYLVFNNRFSIFTNKVVYARFIIKHQ